MPYTNLMVKYCLIALLIVFQEIYLAFVCCCQQKKLPSEKEKRSFSVLDIVTTVPESVKLIWINKIQDVYEHLNYWLLSQQYLFVQQFIKLMYFCNKTRKQSFSFPKPRFKRHVCSLFRAVAKDLGFRWNKVGFTSQNRFQHSITVYVLNRKEMITCVDTPKHKLETQPLCCNVEVQRTSSAPDS